MDQQTAEVLQSAIASASGTSSGIIATTIGIVTLIVTASDVFGEMQSVGRESDDETCDPRRARLRQTQNGRPGCNPQVGYGVFAKKIGSSLMD
jgi:hypothetical protein